MNERQLVFKNGSLLLSGITRDDEGSYRCSVTSNKMLRTSGDVAVTVMGECFYDEPQRSLIICSTGLAKLEPFSRLDSGLNQ